MMQSLSPPSNETPLRRQLGLAAVAAIVVGDMLGSGIFFTPGELAAVAQAPSQVYFFWALCGVITLCGALTLAELTVLLPRAGASYHVIREGFGPFWAFLKIWIEMWVSGPGSVAGVAILLGDLAQRISPERLVLSPVAWGAAGIVAFTAINLLGVQWGGRTQVALTSLKVLGLLALVLGGLFLAAPAAPAAGVPSADSVPSVLGFLRFVGLGVAVVLFTYDGWVDVSHVAGEVQEPRRNLPRGLGLGVVFVTLVYLVVNYAYLRVVPLEAMRADPSGVAGRVARAAFGAAGGQVVDALMLVSILGALGGLILTLPRLYYAGAAEYAPSPGGGRGAGVFFRAISSVSSRGVPVGAALFSAVLSLSALVAFSTFRRIVTFFVVPLQVVNILMVASVFRLRRRTLLAKGAYLTPGYPVLPAVYVFVLFLFLVSALVYNPLETLAGTVLTATGLPFYLWIRRKERA